MLQNAYLLAKIGADTADNEQHFAEILPKTGNYLHRRARRHRRDDPVDADPGLVEEGSVGGVEAEAHLAYALLQIHMHFLKYDARFLGFPAI